MLLLLGGTIINCGTVISCCCLSAVITLAKRANNSAETALVPDINSGFLALRKDLYTDAIKLCSNLVN